MSAELYSEMIMNLLVFAEKEKCQMKTDFSVNLYFLFPLPPEYFYSYFLGDSGESRELYKEGFCPLE